MKIYPSILSADFANLAQELHAIEHAGADGVHLDVMDGHFVPNLTFGAPVVKKMRPHTSLLFDAHLMVTNAIELIEPFAKAGVQQISVHPECDPQVDKTLQKIHHHKLKAALALNPETSAEVLKPLLPLLDIVLIMTVNPGFGGQAFLSDQLHKIEEVRKLIDQEKPDIELHVDGGIDATTARLVQDAGASVLIAGTAVFQGGHTAYAQNIRGLRG